jgi:hypothetical protein
MSADRYNAGKLRWSLVDFDAVGEMLKVLEFGAIKYSSDNWKQGLHRGEVLESAQRHLIKLFEEEEEDPESKLLHAGHIMCNMMFYIYYLKNDRFTKERSNPFVTK